MAAQGCPNKTFETFGVPSKRPKSTKRAPERPPGAPKRSPREPPNTLKGIFQSQTLIFLESSPRRSEIKVFEGRKWFLGRSKSTPGGSKIRKKAFRIRVREKERQKRDKYGKRRSRTTVFKMILIEGVVFWSVGVGWMGGRR